MKEKANNKIYFFIDESGDPAFYANRNLSLVGKENFKPLLLIGMIEVNDKQTLRKAVIDFMNDIKSDPLYNGLPCVTNPKGWYLHASYDNLEIQVKFIELLRKLSGFKFYAVVGRKRVDVFHKKHNKNETEFYFDLVYHLLKNRLDSEAEFYQIQLSARNKNTQHKLKEAIDKSLKTNNEKREQPLTINYNSEIVQSKDTPELSIVDYLLWALQRYIIKGEKRFFTALESKYDLIIDLYDLGKKSSNYYDKNNPFDIKKASEFRTDGYI